MRFELIDSAGWSTGAGGLRGYRSSALGSALGKSRVIHYSLVVISVSSVWRWAVASNERAVANARAAATECSRLRVERAEVEQFLQRARAVAARTSCREGGADGRLACRP